jgi:hypothetical protein
MSIAEIYENGFQDRILKTIHWFSCSVAKTQGSVVVCLVGRSNPGLLQALLATPAPRFMQERSCHGLPAWKMRKVLE